MTRRVFFCVVGFLILACLSWAAPAKKVIVHYHWTETGYDAINLNAVKIFNKKHPEVEVKLLLLPDGDKANIIRTVLAANGQIDSFGLSNAESPEFLAAGQAVPIIPAAFGKSSIDEVLKMWTPGALETCGGYWDGKYYGIPEQLSDYVLWINTAFMKEAGLNPDKDMPKTWADFVTVTKKMVKTQDGVIVRNGFMCNSKEGLFSFLVLLAMMEQLGLDWGTEKGFIASMDQTDTLVRGLKTYTDFVTTDKIWDPALTSNDREGFGTGKSATFLTGGTWYWGVLDSYSVKRKDVQPIPYPRFPDGKDIGGLGYGTVLCVSRLAKDPKLTFEWLDTMASQPNEMIKLGNYQPRLRLSDGTQALDPALARKFIPNYDAVFKNELAKPAKSLFSTKNGQATSVVWDAISRVIYQNVGVEDSVAQMQKDIKGIYQ
jgi:multiple sugar transport system substrate-binding protein